MKRDSLTGIVIATKEQMESIGVTDIPNGALVEMYDIDKYKTEDGTASKIRYKFENFDYIFPTKWVLCK